MIRHNPSVPPPPPLSKWPPPRPRPAGAIPGIACATVYVGLAVIGIAVTRVVFHVHDVTAGLLCMIGWMAYEKGKDSRG